MSVSSIGGAAGNVSQLMASLLSRLKDSQGASSTAASSTATATTPPDNQLTGSPTVSLSDQVLGVLVMMQGQSGGASTGNDPVSQAFSSLDTDGDGTLSQSELESAIGNAGGTADEADSIFAALGGTASTGLSQDSFAAAAQAGGPPPGGPPSGGPQGAHHHHHHHAGSASQDASQIFTALDSNQDGSVSADELTAALGGTDSSGSTSDSMFSAIDANGDGAVSQDELKTYLGNLQQQSTSDQASLGTLMGLASQSYSTALKASASTAASALATA